MIIGKDHSNFCLVFSIYSLCEKIQLRDYLHETCSVMILQTIHPDYALELRQEN